MPDDNTRPVNEDLAADNKDEVVDSNARPSDEELAECIFCKIASGEIPAELVYHDQDIIAFYDIHPRAPIHILVVPRQHITSLAELEKGDQVLVGTMMWVAKYLAESHRIADSGYRIVINTGAGAGQTVPHLHLHLLGGQRMSEDSTL